MNHIAFLGVGNMGAGMAGNLARAQRPVTAYDPSLLALAKAEAAK